MIITSFGPNRLEAQDKAVSTWNQEILAVQCIGEDFAKDFTSNIEWVKPNRHWSKKTPSIVDILKHIKEPSILINSDIEIEPGAIDNWGAKPGQFTIGLRTDYCKRYTQLNKYGFDVFLITPEMTAHLDNSVWALGIPAWDYWIVWKMLLEDYTLDIHKEGFLHAAHHEQWNQDDYRRCSKLLEFEFDIPVTDIADTLQELTGRTQLPKRTYIED